MMPDLPKEPYLQGKEVSQVTLICWGLHLTPAQACWCAKVLPSCALTLSWWPVLWAAAGIGHDRHALHWIALRLDKIGRCNLHPVAYTVGFAWLSCVGKCVPPLSTYSCEEQERNPLHVISVESMFLKTQRTTADAVLWLPPHINPAILSDRWANIKQILVVQNLIRWFLLCKLLFH